MNRITPFLCALLIALCIPDMATAQKKTKADAWKGKKPWEFFINVAIDGAGVGAKRKWGNMRKTMHGLTLQMVGVRGDDEQRFYSYYTGRVDVQRSRYMFMFPLHYSWQRRLFAESVEDNFRPFIAAEAGPTFGIRFPSGHGLGGNLSRTESKVTLGGFLGGGMEFEVGKAMLLSISGGYRFAKFFSKFQRRGDDMALIFDDFGQPVIDPQTGEQARVNRVPDEQSFNSVEIRLGLVTGL
jgi:hypothetical protein